MRDLDAGRDAAGGGPGERVGAHISNCHYKRRTWPRPGSAPALTFLDKPLDVHELLAAALA